MGWLSKCALLAVLLAAIVVAFWRAVILTPIKFSPVDLSHKVAIVTGGTDGIGLETVAALASWNATVVLPVRNLAKGERVKKEILARLPRGSTGAIELMECDLASFASVRKFTATLLAKQQDFDMLVLNAGMQSGPGALTTTEDGVESVYQVNHLSHFLMTRLLVKGTASPPYESKKPVEGAAGRKGPLRVVHVSSFMHYLGVLDQVAYSKETRNADRATADLMNSYSTTKLMNVLFSNSLQTAFGASVVTSIAVHPGFVVSSLDRNLPPPFDAWVPWLRQQIARNTEEGAVTQVTAATHPGLGDAGGQYLEDRCIENLCKSCMYCNSGGGVVPKSASTDSEKQDWLWKTSSAIVGLPEDPWLS